jgi:polyhydroxyalkanoate synthase
VSLADVRVPVFLVGTETDHVAPWRSVYKLHYLSPAEITFVLTSGGHNAGIVNPPAGSRRHYRMLTSGAGTSRKDPVHWFGAAPEHEGSWWPALQQWLHEHSGAAVAPPRMGLAGARPLDDAPGRYILEK